MSRIAGLVQARMGSSRLPGKVMLPLGGRPLVGQIFSRMRAVRNIDCVVLATTADPRNKLLVEFAKAEGVTVYEEDSGEDDIAARLANAAALVEADAILKVNADCPIVDPRIMQQAVDIYRTHPDIDYVSNKVVWTWPEGMSVEVISKKSLDWCNANLSLPEDRELVANWIKNRPDRFPALSFQASRKWCDELPSLAVDTPEDYKLLQRLFKDLEKAGSDFSFEQIAFNLAGAS